MLTRVTELMKIISLSSTGLSGNINMTSPRKDGELGVAVSLSVTFVLITVIIVLAVALCCCYYRQRRRGSRYRSTEKGGSDERNRDDEGKVEVSILDSNKVT